ncbi:MAG: hypothetical protein A2084_00760 [Tenericutes bacterium GWC2_39_45]|nr:MAG: hypothetical protein A2084_00760 [Tenericutes bacterium GWC2_39_45]OHE32816.1 MAG: hypothetical protein A2009_03865 [Tenericutes bacterium GWD2_38_27]OHE39957.1 MAG: hypothetical protein A2013_04210 [Tenericutes bacterium GWE2_38_8]OHE40917.1 MAG: hypothetical protein A2102_06245 [Tenericutes bacterium GWF2_38_8]HBG32262.1 hypothetical protein [Acholeplasmataceae bacterium]
MNILDFTSDVSIEAKIIKQLEIIRKIAGRENYNRDYFIKQIGTPDTSLLGSFQSIKFIDVYCKNMKEIYDIIKEIAKDNIMIITEWTFMLFNSDKEDFNKDSHGEIIPAYPNLKDDRNDKPYYKYYCLIDDKSFQTYEEMNIFLENWLRGFDSYSGYIIKKDQIDICKTYLFENKKSLPLEMNFKNSIIGFFSGTHECNTLVVMTK